MQDWAKCYGGLAAAHEACPPSARCWCGSGEKQADTPGTRATQELPERRCVHQRTALGTPTPDFSSGFTPEASSSRVDRETAVVLKLE